MSEEIQNASVVVPQAMVWSIIINGVLGFSMLMAVLFSLGDIEAVLTAPYLYPFIQIFVQGTGHAGAATGIAVIIIVLAFCTTIAVLASSSRMTWAFARDRGLTGWQSLSKACISLNLPRYTALRMMIFLAWYFSQLLISTMLKLWLYAKLTFRRCILETQFLFTQSVSPQSHLLS